MHTSIEKLNFIKNKVKLIIDSKQLKTEPKVIAVTKTFPINRIIPLLDSGHLHFGENKIQEAEVKWSAIREKYKGLQLHMLGKLQTNKVKKAVAFFDYIHSLDSPKIAEKINVFQKELNRKIKLFIQVNVGEESQKSGILLSNIDKFYNYCTKELSLDVIGLMCLPPINEDPNKYFNILKQRSTNLSLKDLSMGMSVDYEKAIINGATYLRLGTAIFGERNLIN